MLNDIRDDTRNNTSASVPVELKLAFRYVCPDSPYLSKENSALATDALHPDARDFFTAFGGDKRYLIDPKARLENSNKGATEKQQKLVARATSGAGGDPRTPGLFMMPPPPRPKTQRQQAQRLALYRCAWGMEQYLNTLGIDFTKAPTEVPPDEEPAPADEPTACGPDASAGRTELASGTPDAQGAARGDQGADDPDGVVVADSSDNEGAEPSADADDGCHESDDDDAPPSPPSPGAVRASTRRASTCARKAPRRSL